MAFRRSILCLHNFSSGIYELAGPNIIASRHQKGSFYYLSNTLTTICCTSRNLIERFRRNRHDYVKANINERSLNLNRHTSYDRNVCTASNVFKQQINNLTLFPGCFMSQFANHSHQRIVLKVCRNFTTLVSNQSRPAARRTSIVESTVQCRRMKHSLPKVPPTRMMSVYEFERTISDEEAAKEFVYALKASERKYLYEELARFHADTAAVIDTANEPPTRQQLKLVALHQMFPFIGFGFLDNFLMIVAGEYIDVMLGTTLGISTMAAAALGNWFSDVCGLGSAHYVETVVSRFGIRYPHLTPAQADMKSTKWASNLGKVIGVSIGCFLGMIPLLFFKDEKKEKLEKESKEASDDKKTQSTNEKGTEC